MKPDDDDEGGSSTDWAVFDGPKQAFQCARCDGSHRVTFPIPLDVFAKMCRAFLVLHSRCLPK